MKKTFIGSGIAVLLCATTLVACSNDEHSENNVRKTITLSRSQADNMASIYDFSLGFYASIGQEFGYETNFAVSPFSVASVLGIYANVASDSVQGQILQSLNIEARDLVELNGTFSTINSQLSYLDSRAKLKFGNSLWLDQAYNYNTEVSSSIADVFGADIKSADFQNDGGKQIVKWMSDITGGIDKFEIYVADLNFCVANALLFNGKWSHSFEKSKTEKSEFFNGDESVAQVDMMLSTELYGAVSLNTTHSMVLTELPYGSGAFSMYLLIPDGESSLKECVEEFAKRKLPLSLTENISNTSSYGSYRIKMPKFEIRTMLRDELVRALYRCGVPEMQLMASNLTETSSALRVGQMVQGVELKVDEEGTVVKVHTAQSGDLANIVISDGTINVDHPFAFFVVENSTRAIIAAGQVNHM